MFGIFFATADRGDRDQQCKSPSSTPHRITTSFNELRDFSVDSVENVRGSVERVEWQHFRREAFII